MAQMELRPKDYLPQPPKKKDYGIGLVGCGGIARNAHLPSYRQFGYRVVHACDIKQENLKAAVEGFDIPKGTTELDELLADPKVEIVDLAVHANQRRPLVERIAEAGKHIFSQKPFAMDYQEAVEMVEICEQAGVTLMINQQARWAPQHAAIKWFIDQGHLGHVYNVMHVIRSYQDRAGHWFTALENAVIVDHGCHYIDLSRHFAGLTPARVKCTTTWVPEQNGVTPMIYSMTLEYQPEAKIMSTLHFNDICYAPPMFDYTWWVDGTEGSLRAGRRELTFAPKDGQMEYTFHLQGSWFPDAFGGSMAEMMNALTEKREPLTSGRDNLDTVRVAYAAVMSSNQGRAVGLSEIA